jgi:hypothetical protein
MNKLSKLTKSFNILWIFGITIFLLVLALLYPEIDKIIQSELIVILVVITWFYAIQTKKIVEQEKKTFEQERKKQIAMYAENKLQKFYIPFSFKLSQFNTMIEALNWQNFREEKDKADKFFTKEISLLILKYMYLAPRETVGFTATINIFFKEMDGFKENEEEKFYQSKQEFLKTIKSISVNIFKKSHDCMTKINQAYDIYEPSDFEAAGKILSLTSEVFKKKNST